MCDDFNPLDLLGQIPEALGITGSSSGKKHQKQFGKAAEDFQQYKEQMRPTTMQGLRQGLSAYGPALEMLEQMYGPTAQFDIEQLLQDPAIAAQANPPPTAEDLRLQKLAEPLKRGKK